MDAQKQKQNMELKSIIHRSCVCVSVCVSVSIKDKLVFDIEIDWSSNVVAFFFCPY